MRQAVRERVQELRHDLGKYLVLPLSMLPGDASPEQLRAALHTALRQTRRGPTGTLAARELWARFDAELGERLRGCTSYAPLEAAVARALQWEAALEDPRAVLPRARLLLELRAVRDAIDTLDEELAHG